jgi:pyruvate/2-oxoglutarate dehydrogenase complex dihydrolipoamide acyltransferase (E2) component
MPSIPIIMPQLGESIAEAKVISFLVKPGDSVGADQDLIEVETNKAAMTVTSPCRGRIEKLTARLGESYAVGSALGQIEATREEAARLGLDVSAPAKTGDTDRISNAEAGGGKYRVQPTVRGLPVPANVAGAGYLSPRLKARMNELGLSAADVAGIAGSGAAGRVTVEDFEKFIAHH